MDVETFKGTYYFFELPKFGRVFVFIDFGNVRPWAKELWPEENKFRFCSEIDKYDTVMLFSGDSDFSGLLSYFKNKGKKIVIVCSRPRMSKELYEVADKFIPAESLKDFLHYKNNTPPR